MRATKGLVCLNRDCQAVFSYVNISKFDQDTYMHRRLTAQLCLRYDYNHDQALGSSVGANPLVPHLLPAVSFAGADPGVIFHNLSPRLGFTYDVAGDGGTLVRANYARYFGQVGAAGVSGQLNPVSRVSVRYPWVDENGDKFVQA